MTIRSLLPLSVAAAVAILAARVGTAGPVPVPARPRPTTLDELGRLLDAQPGRLEVLHEQANRDPRYRDVERYRSLKGDEYDSPKRVPKTEKVLDLVFAADAEPALRLAAFEALTTQSARAYDPDLREDRRRNRFSMQNVVDHLDDEDARNRGFADDWLKRMHGNATDPAILAYDRREQGEKTWKPAINAWKRILRR